MKRISLVSFFVALAAFPGSPNGALADGSRRLIEDAADGQLDEFTLVEAALIAGATTESPAMANARFDRLACELQQACKGSDSDLIRVKVAFKLLQERVLSGQFNPECFCIQKTLDHGEFNCLTATIIFQCLCRQVGLPVVAIASDSHIYCRLLGKETADIETTCPNWFDSTESKLAQTGLAGLEVSDVKAVARIYYNRGIVEAHRGRFADAVCCLKSSIRLDGSFEPAVRNLLAAYNNWAISLCHDERFDEAAAMIMQAKSIAPDRASVLYNEQYIRQKWAEFVKANQHLPRVTSSPQPR